MIRPKECKFECICPDCEFFTKKWGEVTICSPNEAVVFSGEGIAIHEECERAISSITEICKTNQKFLHDVEQNRLFKQALTDDGKKCMELFDEYNSLKSDLAPWLDGCKPENEDSKRLYKFFETAEKIKSFFEENHHS